VIYTTTKNISSGSRFNGLAEFTNSKFSDKADFSYSTFNATADFGGSSFTRSIDITNAQFNGFLIGFNNIRNVLISFNPVSYLKLIQNLKGHGQFEEADQCYYLYKLRYMSGLADFIAWLTCGFGVDWRQTIYFGLFWLLLFGLVYFMQMDLMQIREQEEYRPLRTLFDSFWFSAVVLLSVPKELYPNKEETYKAYAKHISFHLPIVERLIGWGILILFINTLSRVMLHL
jgi:hypothetical protein